MPRSTRAALLAAAAILAACSAETPTAPRTAPSDQASHSGYTVTTGRTCNPDEDPNCTGYQQ